VWCYFSKTCRLICEIIDSWIVNDRWLTQLTECSEYEPLFQTEVQGKHYFHFKIKETTMRWTLMLEAEDKEGIQSENSGFHGGEYEYCS
jgi:hypothetical protein